MDTNRTNLRVALIMGAAVIAVAVVLYVVFTGYINKPDPAALVAEAALSEAQAKEYEGESILVKAKADLVSSYPDTISAAGSTALQFGLGFFLLMLGLGAGWLVFSVGTTFVIRSSANAYRDVNAVRVLPKLPGNNVPDGFLAPGVAGDWGVDSTYMGTTSKGASSGTSTKSATTGGGGADGAKKRYADRTAKGKK